MKILCLNLVSEFFVDSIDHYDHFKIDVIDTYATSRHAFRNVFPILLTITIQYDQHSNIFPIKLYIQISNVLDNYKWFIHDKHWWASAASDSSFFISSLFIEYYKT